MRSIDFLEFQTPLLIQLGGIGFPPGYKAEESGNISNSKWETVLTNAISLNYH